MKLLFVCAQNVGRSQMAAALYNKMTNSSDADSAGTIVDVPGQTIGERMKTVEGARHVVLAMDEEGIDIRSHTRKLIAPSMLGDFDQVIVMAEPDTIEAWLRDAPQFMYWKIADARLMDMEGTRRIREQIRERVTALIAEAAAS